MKKYILGLVLSLTLAGGIVYATAPGGSSTTIATGTATAPVAVHNIVLPATTLDLGSKTQGSSQSFDLPVRNGGNVTDSVKGTVISSSGVTITSAKFVTPNSDTISLPAGGGVELFTVTYTVNTIAPGQPNVPISIEVKFDVI